MLVAGVIVNTRQQFWKRNAGIAKKLMETPNSAGPTALPDSADLPKPPPESATAITPVAEVAAVVSPRKPFSPFTDNPDPPDKEFLKALGISRKVATRMLANGKSDAYLNTRVTARVYIVHQANSAEVLMLSQKHALMLGRNKKLDPRVRAACLAVVPQCTMALARLSEVALATARSMDVPDESGENKVIKPTQNNFFAFPPVAAAPKRTLQSSAINGNEDAVDVSVEPKAV